MTTACGWLAANLALLRGQVCGSHAVARCLSPNGVPGRPGRLACLVTVGSHHRVTRRRPSRGSCTCRPNDSRTPKWLCAACLSSPLAEGRGAQERTELEQLIDHPRPAIPGGHRVTWRCWLVSQGNRIVRLNCVISKAGIDRAEGTIYRLARVSKGRHAVL